MKTDNRGNAEKRACSRKESSEKGMIALCHSEKGKIGWIILWLAGIPIPILLVLFILRGCT